MDFGKTWQHQRKAFRMALNAHGDGRKKLEESYMNLLGDFIETLKAKREESFVFKDSIANLITCSMYGMVCVNIFSYHFHKKIGCPNCLIYILVC